MKCVKVKEIHTHVHQYTYTHRFGSFDNFSYVVFSPYEPTCSCFIRVHCICNEHFICKHQHNHGGQKNVNCSQTRKRKVLNQHLLGKEIHSLTSLGFVSSFLCLLRCWEKGRIQSFKRRVERGGGQLKINVVIELNGKVASKCSQNN